MTTAQQIIEFFGMKPLPNEGGFYIETYRCRGKLVPSVARPERTGCVAITVQG